MPVTLLTNEVIPSTTDDILASLTPMVQSIGRIVQTTSIDSARALLSQLEAASLTPTASHPLYLDIGGNLYRSTGGKVGGAWTIEKMDETEAVEDTFATGNLATLAYRQITTLVTSSLPARPYDRSIAAWGIAYGQVTTGAVNVAVTINGRMAEARFDTGRDDASAANAMCRGIIKAGVTPVITLGLRGDNPSHGSSTIQTASNAAMNRLYVEARPITMK